MSERSLPLCTGRMSFCMTVVPSNESWLKSCVFVVITTARFRSSVLRSPMRWRHVTAEATQPEGTFEAAGSAAHGRLLRGGPGRPPGFRKRRNPLRWNHACGLGRSAYRSVLHRPMATSKRWLKRCTATSRPLKPMAMPILKPFTLSVSSKNGRRTLRLELTVRVARRWYLFTTAATDHATPHLNPCSRQTALGCHQSRPPVQPFPLETWVRPGSSSTRCHALPP